MTSLALKTRQASNALRQRRTVVGALAALDLDELFDQLPPAAVEPRLDRRALRLEAKAALALPLGAKHADS